MTGGGVVTHRWGWQPTAWLQNGLPTWAWRGAPSGLVTRRQMRELGLAPGGAQPVAQVVCRRGHRRACQGTGRTTDHQPDLPAAIECALTDYRGSEDDHDSPTRWALDRIQQMTSHAQVETWLADGTVDAQTAAAYHAVLITAHDDLAAALSADRPVVARIVIPSGGEQR